MILGQYFQVTLQAFQFGVPHKRAPLIDDLEVVQLAAGELGRLNPFQVVALCVGQLGLPLIVFQCLDVVIELVAGHGSVAGALEAFAKRGH